MFLLCSVQLCEMKTVPRDLIKKLEKATSCSFPLAPKAPEFLEKALPATFQSENP